MDSVLRFSALAIDCVQVSEGIKSFIRNMTKEQGADGVVLGLSGGVDSAVLATLSASAVGPERVQTFHLYDRTSQLSSRHYAKSLADWLKINFHLIDIDPEMQNRGLYSPFIMKVVSLSESTNRRLSKPLFGGENPFVSTLRKGDFGGNSFKKFIYKRLLGPVEHAFCQRHIYRRKFLEEVAREKNCLLVGAANRSEVMVGWFVKNGVDDLLHSPLNKLYKTQIYQLAKYLGIPNDIIERPASPDMIKGVSDECALGIDYGSMDTVLYGIDNDMSDDELLEAGVTSEQIAYVRKLYELSEWKRIPD